MATLITYQDLKDARDNGTLTVDTEYEVSDYPTFHPIVKAVAVDELSEAGTTSDGKTILYSLDSDNPNPPAGFKGLIIYMSNGNVEAWFDWVNNGTVGNSANVKIGPTYDSDGYRCPYQGAIVQCVNVVVYGNNTLNMLGCQNAIVGSGNSGELRGCQYITVGDSNTSLSVQYATGCQIGSNNSNVTVTADDTEIGDNNQDITISAPNGSVGTGNRVINVTSEEFEIENDCVQVNVSAKYNKIANTKYADIKAPYNTVKDSNSIELVDSVGNVIDSSHLVYLRDVNNNDIYTSKYIQDTQPYTRPDGTTVQYNTPEPQPFIRIRPNNWQKPYRVASSMISGMSQQADNFGVVVDKITQERKSKSIPQKYYISDGVWTIQDTEVRTGYVTMVMPKSESGKVVVVGWGEHQIGTTVTLDFNYVEWGYTARFVDQNGVHHSAPYSFIITADTEIGVAVTVTPPVQHDEIRYTSTDNQVVTPYNTSVFGGATIVSNTYSGDEGVIKFDRVLTEVGYNAFRGCTTLSSILLPDSVTTIGSYAFYGTSLTSFHLPKSVTSVSNTLFGKTAMTQLEVDDDNTVYDSRNSCNAIIHTASNELKVGCSVSTVPNTVTSIGYAAFDDIDTLTSITIPASVTTIGTYAFNGCGALSAITLLGNAPSVSALYFSNFREYGVLYGQGDTDYSSFMAALPPAWTLSQPVVSPDDEIWYTSTDSTVVTPYSTGAFGASIVSNTYSGGKGIIKFDGPVTQIGGSAFYNRSKLASICIPNSVTSTGTNAFYQCDNLASVTIGSGLTSIGDSSFRSTGLTSIHIPHNVTSLGSDALRQCDSLVTAAIVGPISRFGWCNFYGDSTFANLVFYDTTTVPTIGTTVFTGVANSGKVYGQPGLDYSAVMSALPNAWTLVQ